MYTGHFAAGLALTARERRVSPWAIFVGVGFIDLLDGALVAAGVERVKPDLAVPLGFDLDFIDWDHSLLMACVWSLVFGLGAYWVFGRDRRTGAFAGLAAISHIVLDLVVHNGDIALYPYARTHLGLYVWRDYPTGSYFLELALDLACAAYFVVRGRKAGVPAKWIAAPVALLLFIHLNWWPPLNPMRLVAAHVPMPRAMTIHGMLVVAGFVVPGLIFGWLCIDRANKKATAKITTT